MMKEIDWNMAQEILSNYIVIACVIRGKDVEAGFVPVYYDDEEEILFLDDGRTHKNLLGKYSGDEPDWGLTGWDAPNIRALKNNKVIFEGYIYKRECPNIEEII